MLPIGKIMQTLSSFKTHLSKNPLTQYSGDVDFFYSMYIYDFNYSCCSDRD